VLNAIGKLGVKAESYASDIASDGNGGSEGWLIAGGTLYKVDLTSGKATEHGKITGVADAVKDIAVLPKM
jgi:hypothetical protein